MISYNTCKYVINTYIFFYYEIKLKNIDKNKKHAKPILV